jgi:hypothetical protein
MDTRGRIETATAKGSKIYRLKVDRPPPPAVELLSRIDATSQLRRPLGGAA